MPSALSCWRWSAFNDYDARVSPMRVRFGCDIIAWCKERVGFRPDPWARAGF